MPGRDGTGPSGSGAMTGRGLGFCIVANAVGCGTSFGFGPRRGLGRNPVTISTLELLQEQKKLLESRLENINKQLENV